MRILRGQSNLEVSSKGFALLVAGLLLATFLGGALRTVLNSDQVQRRLVTELRKRFPHHDFHLGHTEVLLARGMWPGLGLRLHDLSFQQKMCGKLSFLLTIPRAVLPLDLWSLAQGTIRLNTVEIFDGRMHLDYYDCAAPALPAASMRVDTDHHGTVPTPRSVAPLQLNWSAWTPLLNGLRLNLFTITYEKNPTLKLILNTAHVSFGEEISATAGLDVQKSLPFGALSRPMNLELRGESNVLHWNVNMDFKEGHVHQNGSLDMKTQTAISKIVLHQLPIRDFMNEAYQMGFVAHDLKLKATWLSCTLDWTGILQNYAEFPVRLQVCRLEGGYGRAELGSSEIWFHGPNYLKVPSTMQISQLDIQPVLEAFNRQVLPAVISRLGAWSGTLEFLNATTWRLNGVLENAEIVFSNASMHGKQGVERVRTEVNRNGGKINGKLDEVQIRDGEFAGFVDFSLSDDWREGEFRSRIDRFTLSPIIQKILVGGTVSPLKAYGQGALQAGELNRWDGTVTIPRMQGEGWRAENLSLQSRFKNGIFSLEGTAKEALVEPSWRFSHQLRKVSGTDVTIGPISFHDLSTRVEIQKTGGVLHSLRATSQGRVWKAKGTWRRDSDFSGILAQGEQIWALHGEKGNLNVHEEMGASR